jgi:hypothetical protein
VIDRGEDEGRHFIVFEYVEGENLKALIERSGRVPIRRALELTIASGEALAFAHAHGLVHRDVKPQNVLLDGDGELKVTDFGIARSVNLQSVTESGTVLGTSYYIAPEQASGEAVAAQTDVYSLGVVLFELLTGRLPFEGESFVAVAMQHVREPAPSVLDVRPEVPVRVARAVERALAKDPAARPSSMDEFVSELRACLAELGTGADQDATAIKQARVPAPRRPRPAPVRRRRVWPLVVTALAIVVLAAAAVAALLSTRNSSPPASEPGGADDVRLSAVADYDPEGGDGEHPEAVARATDGDPSTFWYTETYEDFGAAKSGVGLVLDAGADASLAKITVRTSTPGFTARIDAGDQRGGPFEPATDEQEVNRSATFSLDDVEARYFVVWITELPEGVARITEVRAG